MLNWTSSNYELLTKGTVRSKKYKLQENICYINLTKDLYPEYINNFYVSVGKNNSVILNDQKT